MTVVVTGLGAVSSIGRDTGTFVRQLLAGNSGIRAMTAAERTDARAEWVSRIDGWTAQPEISGMKARRLDLGSQYAVVASLEAVRQSGFPISEKPDRVGIALGTGSAGSGALTEFIRVLLTESPEAAPPFHFPNTIANAPASQVSLELKFLGPNVTITQKDPSALNAAIYAAGCIEEGRVDAMITGGVDEWNSLYSSAMDHMRALRGRKRSSGIVQGEGCFVVFLEEERAALERSATVLARLSGYAFAGSPCPPYAFVEDEGAAERAIRGALERAGQDAGTVDLVMLSRSGRTAMDALERKIVDRVFGGVATIAVKDSIGEMAAAGGAQLVAGVSALAAGTAKTVLVNSFGAGGNFLAVVLERP